MDTERNKEFLEILKTRLTPQRLYHSICVAEQAKHLAEKFGFNPEKAYTAGLVHDIMRYEPVEKMLELACKMDCVKVKGLMTIGSLYADLDENKKLFEICNNLFVDISAKKYDNISMEYLSMGMSGDFEAAIEMGSNMVRVGTSIFGKRNYNI